MAAPPLDIIGSAQLFMKRRARVELHQRCGEEFACGRQTHLLCQDLIGWTGRRKVAMTMLGARRLTNMDIST
ncbi:hypothetical protein XH88_19255 [Bradyrhizobium sp. CCBAU 51627]|nr:hypothetical protein [Bradyrhizobium sp. CCBAU 51627]